MSHASGCADLCLLRLCPPSPSGPLDPAGMSHAATKGPVNATSRILEASLSDIGAARLS